MNAHHDLASDLFRDPDYRRNAFTSAPGFLENISTLHPSIHLVMTSLEDVRKSLVQTYRDVERNLGAETRINFDVAMRLYVPMADHFYSIAQSLKEAPLYIDVDRVLRQKIIDHDNAKPDSDG